MKKINLILVAIFLIILGFIIGLQAFVSNIQMRHLISNSSKYAEDIETYMPRSGLAGSVMSQVDSLKNTYYSEVLIPQKWLLVCDNISHFGFKKLEDDLSLTEKIGISISLCHCEQIQKKIASKGENDELVNQCQRLQKIKTKGDKKTLKLLTNRIEEILYEEYHLK